MHSKSNMETQKNKIHKNESPDVFPTMKEAGVLISQNHRKFF